MDIRQSLSRQLSTRVEELWESASSLPLPEEEKLNACFEKIPVSLFPPTQHGQVIELMSDTSLHEAIQTLAKNRILSAPVRDVDAQQDASWMDKYLGVIEFAGITHWVLHQAELTTTKAFPSAAVLEAKSPRSPRSPKAPMTLEAVPAVGGDFFTDLTSSDIYRSTQVKDLTGSFRWAPFVPVQNSDCLLTLLLLLSKYRIKSLPVVESGEGRIENLITQSAVIHMLSECSGLPWFETLGNKSLAAIGLPKMKPDKVFKIEEDQPILHAFQLMRMKGIGGLPVVTKGGERIIGNISMRDIQFLLVAPEIYKSYSFLTVKDFLEATRGYLLNNAGEVKGDLPLLSRVITCSKDEITRDVISKLDRHSIHRVYVVDEEENLEGVVTMRDLISKFVFEPADYFGEFFVGWAPSCPSPH